MSQEWVMNRRNYLASHEYNKWDVELGIRSLDKPLHVGHFLLQNMRVLALRNSIAEVHDDLWKLAASDRAGPGLQKWLQHVVDILGGDHLHPKAVRLARGGVANAQPIHTACKTRDAGSLSAG